MKTSPAKNQNRWLLPVVCIALSLGLLFAGLWPFRFRTVNDVRWIGGSPGLRFERFGIVSGKEPPFGPERAVDLSLPFTLRMEVRPREEPSGSLPRILSAYDGEGRELFFLAQWRAGLVLRILEGERLYRLKYRENGAGGVRKDATHSIGVRSEDHALTLFVDGAPAKTRSGVAFSLLSGERGPAWMILGNSPSGESPWRGDLHSLSFYQEALTPGNIESRGKAPFSITDFRRAPGRSAAAAATPDTTSSSPPFSGLRKKGFSSLPGEVKYSTGRSGKTCPSTSSGSSRSASPCTAGRANMAIGRT